MLQDQEMQLEEPVIQ